MGLLGLVARTGSNWMGGGGAYVGGVPAARTEGGDGWVEAKLSFFIYGPHLVLSVIHTITYAVSSCTALS